MIERRTLASKLDIAYRVDDDDVGTPHQVGREIPKGVNEGLIDFFDIHLSMFPVDLAHRIAIRKTSKSNSSNSAGPLLLTRPYSRLVAGTQKARITVSTTTSSSMADHIPQTDRKARSWMSS